MTAIAISKFRRPFHDQKLAETLATQLLPSRNGPLFRWVITNIEIYESLGLLVETHAVQSLLSRLP